MTEEFYETASCTLLRSFSIESWKQHQIRTHSWGSKVKVDSGGERNPSFLSPPVKLLPNCCSCLLALGLEGHGHLSISIIITLSEIRASWFLLCRWYSLENLTCPFTTVAQTSSWDSAHSYPCNPHRCSKAGIVCPSLRVPALPGYRIIYLKAAMSHFDTADLCASVTQVCKWPSLFPVLSPAILWAPHLLCGKTKDYFSKASSIECDSQAADTNSGVWNPSQLGPHQGGRRMILWLSEMHTLQLEAVVLKWAQEVKLLTHLWTPTWPAELKFWMKLLRKVIKCLLGVLCSHLAPDGGEWANKNPYFLICCAAFSLLFRLRETMVFECSWQQNPWGVE